MNQLSPDNINQLKRIADSLQQGNASKAGSGPDDDDDVPDLVENFEDVSKL